MVHYNCDIKIYILLNASLLINRKSNLQKMSFHFILTQPDKRTANLFHSNYFLYDSQTKKLELSSILQ
ncbi:hypothetical protein EUGRSUZ_G01079 [Eucalyptus grandis]|uniref:Uncharacterized protein n=2 Tax=Eucalyptus grandis TaxID=71139 RepID=A0ACC3K1A4_EUCGR|nr:hypothetical protein EUGRSUZ_G01079 [Eucalyptus grandis]